MFFSSDHHFFLKGLSRYRRFLSVNDMNNFMIEKWNSIIKNDDDWVFYLGDLTVDEDNVTSDIYDIMKALKGNKILIRGNLDLQTDDWYMLAGFKAVYQFLNLEGILLTHYPMYERNFRRTHFYECGKFDYVIHGHVHNLNDPHHKLGQSLESMHNIVHYNVAVDHHNFCPLPLESVVPDSNKEQFVSAATNLISSL